MPSYTCAHPQPYHVSRHTSIIHIPTQFSIFLFASILPLSIIPTIFPFILPSICPSIHLSTDPGLFISYYAYFYPSIHVCYLFIYHLSKHPPLYISYIYLYILIHSFIHFSIHPYSICSLYLSTIILSSFASICSSIYHPPTHEPIHPLFIIHVTVFLLSV